MYNDVETLISLSYRLVSYETFVAQLGRIKTCNHEEQKILALDIKTAVLYYS